LLVNERNFLFSSEFLRKYLQSIVQEVYLKKQTFLKRLSLPLAVMTRQVVYTSE
jgi:hypothetical protein